MKRASMPYETIVLATRNTHKCDEIRTMLAALPISVRDLREFPQCPEVDEDGETLEENALKKARVVSRFTGFPALADDTGLEVYYLLGEPGVYSARYAGPEATYEDNNRKLLRRLTQVPERKRGARFRCVIALAGATGERVFEGLVEGSIAFEPRGKNGFGYDPIFVPAGSTKTFAEMAPEEKNAVSHRGRALAALKYYLENLYHVSVRSHPPEPAGGRNA
ncbi:MAG: XTP/dITP diphosphatase [Bacteroidota bacterium]|nr:XTP/dITP diphosphatase [Bacteroidota bacterium]